MEFTKSEYELMLAALRAEARGLTTMMNELEHRNLHNGNQNVAISQRRYEMHILAGKIQTKISSL